MIEPRLMIGTIGTTPLDRTPNRLPGDHGGNIDVPTIGIGASLYLPVFVPGGLLQIGDVHSAMGDGEICMGMECGAELTMNSRHCSRADSFQGP